jgi:VanZ family protein
MNSKFLHTASTRQPSATLSDTRIARRMRAGPAALAVYVLVIVYVSLTPFFGWRPAESFALFSWPKYWSIFDIGINVIAYVPLGALIAAMWRFRARRRLGSSAVPTAVDIQAWIIGVLAATALSLLLEYVQSFLPGRVSSMLDWVANSCGAILGATAVLVPPGRAALARVELWRHRHFAYGAETDWGLLLLALWLFAQMNPAIPFFEAGNVINTAINSNQIFPYAIDEQPHPYDPLFLLPQAVAITFNVCGFALFLSLLLHPANRVWMSVFVIVVLGFVAKVSMAALLLKAPLLIAWMGPGTVIGLSAGFLLFTFFSQHSFRARAFSATLMVFAGALLTKMAGIYGAWSDTLRLFDWPYGQLLNFASLTRWTHEIWPLLALIFLATLFVKHRLEH